MEATSISGIGSAFEQVEAAFPADSERRKQLALLKGVDIEDAGQNAALDSYLVACLTYGIDPVLGNLHLLPERERGEDGQEARDVLKPHAGRDVFLSIAQRDPRYEGMDFGVHCANDTFDVRFEDGWRVKHTFAKVPKGAAAVAAAEAMGDDAPQPAEFRGPILGAWAMAYVAGRRPTFHYAPLGGRAEDGGFYWDTYAHEMMAKVAQSYVLRVGLGITGLVPTDELANRSPADAPAGAAEPTGPETWDVEWGDDGELAEKLQAAMAAANDLEPFAWTAAKAQMVLNGRTQEERERILGTIDSENAARRERIASEAPVEAGGGGGAKADEEKRETVTAADVGKGDVVFSFGENLNFGDGRVVESVEKADGDKRRLIVLDGNPDPYDLAADDTVVRLGDAT